MSPYTTWQSPHSARNTKTDGRRPPPHPQRLESKPADSPLVAGEGVEWRGRRQREAARKEARLRRHCLSLACVSATLECYLAFVDCIFADLGHVFNVGDATSRTVVDDDGISTLKHKLTTCRKKLAEKEGGRGGRLSLHPISLRRAWLPRRPLSGRLLSGRVKFFHWLRPCPQP